MDLASNFDRFWTYFGSQVGPKMGPKWSKNRSKLNETCICVLKKILTAFEEPLKSLKRPKKNLSWQNEREARKTYGSFAIFFECASSLGECKRVELLFVCVCVSVHVSAYWYVYKYLELVRGCSLYVFVPRCMWVRLCASGCVWKSVFESGPPLASLAPALREHQWLERLRHMGVSQYFLNVSVYLCARLCSGVLCINVTHFARNLDQIGAKTGPKIDQNGSKIEPSWGQVGVCKGAFTSDPVFPKN